MSVIFVILMLVPYVQSMVIFQTNSENKSEEVARSDGNSLGKRMVIFSIVLDELLDEVLMDKLI